MTQHSELESLLDALASLADEAKENGAKWREVWDDIKSIGQTFKDTTFPTPVARQRSWNRFQKIIDSVKSSQQRSKQEFDERCRNSEYHLNQLNGYAWSATPPGPMGDLIVGICTGGLSLALEAGLDAILGPFDDRKRELQYCSEKLKEGWQYLSSHKHEMLGRHKQEAFDALNKAKETLDEAWESWKSSKREALDSYHGEKRAAWDARQQKHAEWESRVHENISKLEDRLGRLESALERRQANLTRLEEMRDTAWSDEFRDRTDDWISEENDRISDIESKIDDVRGWLSEARAKLG